MSFPARSHARNVPCRFTTFSSMYIQMNVTTAASQKEIQGASVSNSKRKTASPFRDTCKCSPHPQCIKERRCYLQIHFSKHRQNDMVSKVQPSYLAVSLRLASVPNRKPYRRLCLYADYTQSQYCLENR